MSATQLAFGALQSPHFQCESSCRPAALPPSAAMDVCEDSRFVPALSGGSNTPRITTYHSMTPVLHAHRGDGHQGAAGHGRPGAGPRFRPAPPAAAAAGAAGRGAAADARLAGAGGATGASNFAQNMVYPPKRPQIHMHMAAALDHNLHIDRTSSPQTACSMLPSLQFAILKTFESFEVQRQAQQVGQPPPAKVQRLDVPQQQQTPRPGTAGAYVPMLGTPTAAVQVRAYCHE